MKRATALLAAAVMLVSCSSQDNSGKVHEADNSEFVSIQNLFDGYDELQGKESDLFALPSTIEKPNCEKLFRFPDRRGGNNIPNEEEATTGFLKKCFGDRFDKSRLTYQNNWDGGKTYSFTHPDGVSAVVLHGFPINVIKSPEGQAILSPDPTFLNSYNPSDSNSIVELKNWNCTVGELLNGMQKRLDSEIMPYIGGFEIAPICINNYKNSEDIKYAEIIYGISYQGVMLEDESPMFITQSSGNYQVMTSYSASVITLTVTGSDDYDIFSSTFSEQYPLTETVSEAIPLRSAVGILCEELAEYVRYIFDSVELRYCCKITAPVITGTDSLEDSRILADYGRIETAYFEPTWCFFYKVTDENGEHREAVKVNALTGEITIDTAR